MRTRTATRFLTVCLLASLSATPARAGRALQTVFENEVLWKPDGSIAATVHEAELVGAFFPSLSVNMNEHDRVGQTFRCPGPRLAAIQVGAVSDDSDCIGLHCRVDDVPMTILLREGGPEGDIVARKTYAPGAVPNDLLLKVDLPSDPGMQWYVEAVPGHQDFGRYKVYFYTSRHDTYPAGRMFLGGRPAEGDMVLRVIRARPMKAHRPGEAVLWAARPEANIWMEPARTIGLMLADDPARPVQLQAARRERVSCQLVVTPRPDVRIRSALLSVAPFEGPAGARIGPRRIRIEWLRYRQHFEREKTSGRLYPDALAPTFIARSVAGEPDEPLNRSFWVSVKVPAGVPAGVYRSVATVVVNDHLTLTRELRLEVFDFDLPRRTHTRTGLFGGGGIGDWAFHQWLTDDLADFRIGNDRLWYRDRLSILSDDLAFSEEAYAVTLGPEMRNDMIETARRLNARGLDVTCVTPWGDTYRMLEEEEGGREGVIRFWKAYYPVLKQHDWVDQAYCRIPDEVLWKDLQKTRAIADLFREHAPGVKIMVTEMNAATDVEKLRRAVGIADIWCQSVTFMPVTMDFYRERMAQGEEVWPYIHPYLALNTDPAAGRLFFWMLEQHGLGGACYFAVLRARFQPAWHGVQCHTDTFVGDGDLYCKGAPDTAPNHGLWRTARLYRVGDGLEDREYFWRMNDIVRRAEAQGRLSGQTRERIARIRANLDRVVIGMHGFANDLDELDRIRRDIVAVAP